MYKLCLSLLVIINYAQAQCDGGCKKHLHTLYEDIHCKPIYENPGDCCPVKYDCSHLDSIPAKQCLYKNKLYNIRDQVPKELTIKDCIGGCFCGQTNSFTCAVLDCPEKLGYTPEVGCHFQYDLNECCAVDQICSTTKVTCEVGEKTFLEGQRFVPPGGECLTCICQKGFQGKYVEPFCRKTTCSAEIRHTEDIQNYCAAVYRTSSSCCPYNWICPMVSPTIVKGPVAGQKPDAQCKFGSTILDIGDTFTQDEAKCECLLPPFVTCLKKRFL